MERSLRSRVDADPRKVRFRRSLDGRLLGQSWETPFVELGNEPITAESIPDLIRRFHDAYQARYGNRFEMMPVQGVTYRVQMIVPAEKVTYEARDPGPADAPVPAGRVELCHYDESPLDAAEYRRESLPIGAVVGGPALIREDLANTFVCPGQTAEVGRFGELIIGLAGSS
jgi:N-methylhydantoinase A